MRRAISTIHLKLWRLKIRLLPHTRPKPFAMSPPPGASPSAEGPEKEQKLPPPSELWSEVLSRYLPPLDGLTVVDLGCGRGELIAYLARHTKAALLVGVDEESAWGDGGHGLTDRRIRLFAGPLAGADLAPRSADVIVSANYLHRLPPERVATTLSSCAEILRPGGSLVVRIPLWTAAVPSAVHSFSTPYAQLLLGERDLERLLRARFNESLPYMNWLTASSYVMLFHQAGLEALDVRRISDPELMASSERLERSLPGVPLAELVGTIEAHLIKPVTLADLGRAREFDDTRPAALRTRAAAR